MGVGEVKWRTPDQFFQKTTGARLDMHGIDGAEGRKDGKGFITPHHLRLQYTSSTSSTWSVTLPCDSFLNDTGEHDTVPCVTTYLSIYIYIYR